MTIKDKDLRRALARLADQDAPGKLAERVESAVDDTMNGAINAVAEDLAGEANPRMFRSKAVRLLIQKGAAAMLAEREGRA